MVRLDSARPKVGLGRIHVYLGRCDVSDVRHYRDLIGGVTLQGLPGLKIARALQRAGDDLRDVDVEPGTYRERRSSPTGQMQLGLDVPAFDWIQAQVDLGLGVIRTPARRIRFGDRDALRAELDQSYPESVTVVLAIDGPWLGPRGIETFLDELSSADRDVALVLAASFDPLDTFDRIAGLRRVLQWAVVSGRQLEDLRTDLTGIAAATEGASLAAVGLGTSTRHFCLGLGNRSQRQYADRQRSPLVFVPRLLHWQRANVLGALGPWQGAGLTDCDCQVCSASGDDLQRFDVPSTTEVREQVRAHDAHALGSLVRDLSRVDDAASELKQWRGSAVDRARSVQARTKVRLPMPAWMTSWD